jgi:shikimate dehydrogenase
LFPLSDLSLLHDLIRQHPDIQGLNVTIPYKIQVLPYLNNIDHEADAVGAVNCIRVEGSNLSGFNTDLPAFMETIGPALASHHQRAIILGTGGASRAVRHGFKKLGIDYTLVSRTPEPGQISYTQLTKRLVSQHSILVNTTPLGMVPHEDSCPDFPFEFLNPDYLVYDLIYNPVSTIFLQRAAERGAITINGLKMLHLQAERSWQLWNDPF